MTHASPPHAAPLSRHKPGGCHGRQLGPPTVRRSSVRIGAYSSTTATAVTTCTSRSACGGTTVNSADTTDA